MNALDNASIKDDNSKGLTSFALPEAKSSMTGVSVRYVHFPKSKNVSYLPLVIIAYRVRGGSNKRHTVKFRGNSDTCQSYLLG